MCRGLALIPFLFLPLLAHATPPKIEFWNQQKKGANLFNSLEQKERFQAAKDFGVQIVRLAPNKWLNGRPASELGDFLMGRPGKFKTIDQNDLKLLIRILDEANAIGLKIVLTQLSLPGARWKQHNQNIEERGLWQDFGKQEPSISFWSQLAVALKGHPAVVGYNFRNEPSPELVAPQFVDWFTGNYSDWYHHVENTPADLNLYYQKLVQAVREVDSEIPLVLDTGFYATAWGFKVLKPVADDKVIYSFHMYEPFSYTSRFNQNKYTYPGKAPLGELEKGPLLDWNKKQLDEYLTPIDDWQKKFNIPSRRIFVGEFGVVRTHSGALQYLKDLIEIFNKRNWHWAFYSFREDTWSLMDYELGSDKPGWRYWQAIERKQIPGSEVYKRNPMSRFLEAALKK